MKKSQGAEPGELMIDLGRGEPRRRRRWLLAGLVPFLLLAAPSLLSIYIEALWFGSVGYAPVFWYADS